MTNNDNNIKNALACEKIMEHFNSIYDTEAEIKTNISTGEATITWKDGSERFFPQYALLRIMKLEEEIEIMTSKVKNLEEIEKSLTKNINRLETILESMDKEHLI